MPRNIEVKFSHLEYEERDDYMTAWPVYVATKGRLDRKYGTGLAMGLGRWDLFERLEAAMKAGKANPVKGVGIDVDGNSYVKTDHNVGARQMNADLRRIGY